MAAVSKTDIINIALGHLKQRPITAIDPPIQEAAKIAVKYYDNAILAMLRIIRPPWAKKQAQISADADAPLAKFAYKYAFPDDYVALTDIGDQSLDDYQEDYDILADGLLIDEPGPIVLTYVFQQFDIGKFDSIAVMCATYTLAELMAYEVTGNGNLRDAMAKKAAEYEIKTRSIGGQERPPRRRQVSRYGAARRRSSSRIISSS